MFIWSCELSIFGSKWAIIPAQVDSFEPIEDVHTVLHVHHPHEAGEDAEDGGLGGSEAVNDHGGFVLTGQARDAVHQVDTVGHRDTEVRPVGTEDDLDRVLHVLHLQLQADALVAGGRGLGRQGHSEARHHQGIVEVRPELKGFQV